MADIEKIRRNIKRMIDGGASEAEIDQYIAGEGVTLDQIRLGSGAEAGADAPEQMGAGVEPLPETTAEQFVRAAAQGASMGGSDEAAAFSGALSEEASRAMPKMFPRGAPESPALPFVGKLAMDALISQYGKGRGVEGAVKSGYGPRLAEERRRLKEIPPGVRIPSEIAGALATGAGAAPLAVRGGATTLGRIAGGAATGAASGGAYGFGTGEGEEDRLRGAATGTATGAAAGGIIGGVSGRLAQKAAAREIPTTEQLRQAAHEAYQAAENAGVIINKLSFRRVVDKIQNKMAREGMDATLHPRVTATMNRLMDATDENITLKGMDILRQVARNAASSTDPGERRLASIIIDKLDNYMEHLGKTDVITGGVANAAKHLRNARQFWSRFRKAEYIENLIERAGNRASQFSGSGYENALRTEFRRVLQNPKELRRFTPKEQAAIRRVAKGGSVANLLRMIGKFAPTGVVSSTLSGGTGYMLGGPAGAIGLPAAGFAARRGATVLTSKAAKRAADIARMGAEGLPKMSARQPAALPPAITGATVGTQRALDELPPWLRQMIGY